MDRKTKIRNSNLETEEISFDSYKEETDLEVIEKEKQENRQGYLKWLEHGQKELEAIQQTFIYKVLDRIVDELIDNEDII